MRKGQAFLWITAVLLFACASAVLAEGRGLVDVSAGERAKVFRAGACAWDVTPRQFPVLVSGGFLEGRASGATSPLHARCLVLDDGTTKVAVAVVDTLMMTREFCDEAKERASKATGIPTTHILLSADHTHAAPSVMSALGTGVQEDYVPVLRDGIARGIEQAAKNLAPARVGWAVADARAYTHCRRWILRPDRVGTDPFGQHTIRAMMHPGYQSPNHVGPAGPVDPDLTLLAVQSPDGRPIAVLANFSMHYFGAGAVSSDYFGLFCSRLAAMLGADHLDPPFVAMMSQGTSGDLHWMNYGQPRKNIRIAPYAEALATIAAEACKKIAYRDWVPLAACEKRLRLARRVPDPERLAWAREIVAAMDGPVPRNQREVYAQEAIYLHNEPTRELKLQAMRVGELGLTAIPCEVYAITGLKLKAQSPLQPTMNLELANGADGYIPPPEQHALGGYTTWPARSAGLEVQAEPKIVETVLDCLEEVAGKPRRKLTVTNGPYAEAILASKPAAYWRMEELAGQTAADATGICPATYEDGIALCLEGPHSPAFSGEGQINRCPHFAGGRLKAAVKGLGARYTVALWIWNGLPADAREVTGYFFSRGVDGAKDGPGDHLGIGGKMGAAGKLIFYTGSASKDLLAGTTEIALRTWHHVALVRDGTKVTVYLDGKVEFSGEALLPPSPRGEGRGEGAEKEATAAPLVFIGGRCDNFANFEGKIDEAALFPRALSTDEIARYYAAAGTAR